MENNSQESRRGLFEKTLLWLIFILAISMMLGACSKSADSVEENKENDREAEEEIVLRVMGWDESVKDIREEFHKQFMEKYLNIKVEYTMLSIIWI